MRPMRTETYRLAAYLLALLLLLPFLTGCASLPEDMPGKFENRPMCALDGKSAIIASQWWFFHFGFDIFKPDAKRICAPQVK